MVLSLVTKIQTKQQVQQGKAQKEVSLWFMCGQESLNILTCL